MANFFDQFDTTAPAAPADEQPRYGARSRITVGKNFFDQFDAPAADFDSRFAGAAEPAPAAMPRPDTIVPKGGEPVNVTQPAPEAPPKSFLQSGHEALSDATQMVGQGLTLGFGDELMAGGLTPIEVARGAIQGQDEGKGLGERIVDSYSRALEGIRGIDKRARERSPVASAVGELAGGAITAGGLAKGGVTLLNAAQPTYRSMIGRGAAEGAAYGAVHGAGTGEGLQDRAQRAAAGAGIGAVTGGAMGGVAARSAANAAKGQGTLTSDDLKDAAKVVYDAADQMGVVVNPASYQGMVQRLWGRLVNEGVDPTLHPGVISAFQRLDELASQPVAFQTLDILRRVANSAGKSIQNKDERRLAGIMVDEIDKLMNGLKPADVVQGNGEAAGKLIVAARDLWSRARKSEDLENLLERAADRVGANYTAAGYQTALRQEFKNLLRNQSALRGFTQDEREMIRGVVRGASVENFLRQVGKLAPRGVVGTTLGGGFGYAAGGPVGAAAVWGVGEAAKRASTAMTNSKVQSLIEFVRRGGPRVLQRLSPQNRALLDTAIETGAITPQELGLMPSAPVPVAIR